MIFEEKKMCVYVWAFKFDKTVRFCKFWMQIKNMFHILYFHLQRLLLLLYIDYKIGDLKKNYSLEKFKATWETKKKKILNELLFKKTLL